MARVFSQTTPAALGRQDPSDFTANLTLNDHSVRPSLSELERHVPVGAEPTPPQRDGRYGPTGSSQPSSHRQLPPESVQQLISNLPPRAPVQQAVRPPYYPHAAAAYPLGDVDNAAEARESDDGQSTDSTDEETPPTRPTPSTRPKHTPIIDVTPSKKDKKKKKRGKRKDKNIDMRFKDVVKKKNEDNIFKRGCALFKKVFKPGHKSSTSQWDEFVENLRIKFEGPGHLKVAQIPVKDTALNEDAFLRCCTLGPTNPTEATKPKKTVLLIGETGTGKSTMINGFINYLLNVNFSDDYRFRLVDAERDAGNILKSESDSQTEYITAYTIPCVEGVSPIDYELTLIDTPGFGDTRGMERDEKLVNQLEEFFTNTNEYGIDTIDAVCFLVKANTNRLTATQRYIFHSLLKIFGKDIKENIVVLATFAHASRPRVLDVLTAGEVDYQAYFLFNNAALYESKSVVTDVDNPNPDEESLLFLSSFWELSAGSYQRFFKYLRDNVKPKSLTLTAQVLRERNLLQLQCKHIHREIQILCHHLELWQEYQEHLENFKSERDQTKFEFCVERVKSVKSFPTDPDVFSVACQKCYRACHQPCPCDVSGGIQGCLAFSEDGLCTVCPAKCAATDHARDNFTYDIEIVRDIQVFPEMAEAFRSAQEKMTICEQKIGEARAEYDKAKGEIIKYIMEGVKALNRLSKIALKQNRVSGVQYIEHVIDDELRAEKKGYETRIKVLQTVMKQFRTTTTDARSLAHALETSLS